MRRHAVTSLVCFALVVSFGGCDSSGDGPSRVIAFTVTVPAGTSGTVYVAASIPEIGLEEGSMLALTDAGSDRWTGTVDVSGEPVGTVVYYKYTRGTWTTVEKGSGCAELPNRELTITGSKTTVTDTVILWADSCP